MYTCHLESVTKKDSCWKGVAAPGLGSLAESPAIVPQWHTPPCFGNHVHANDSPENYIPVVLPTLTEAILRHVFFSFPPQLHDVMSINEEGFDKISRIASLVT